MDVMRVAKRDLDEWEDMWLQLDQVTPEVLNDAGVSKREYEQIQLLLKIDKRIFDRESKTHPHYFSTENLQDHFVDFSRIKHPEKLSVEQKNILYRPQKFAHLTKQYREVCKHLKSNAMRKYERNYEQKVEKIVTLSFEARRLKKPQREIDMQDKLYNAILKFMASKEDLKVSALKPSPDWQLEMKDNWGESLL